MDYLLSLALLLAIGFFIGRRREKKHFNSIREREEELKDILVFSVREIPEGIPCEKAVLASGSVVVALDFFKITWASLVKLTGGNITAYETLLERARREAVIRMKEQAKQMGAGYIINVKFATSNIMSQNGNNNAGCVEMIAYGTALIG